MVRSLVLHVPCFYLYLFLFYDFRWLVEMIALEKACKLFFHIATSFRIRGFILPKDVPNFKLPQISLCGSSKFSFLEKVQERKQETSARRLLISLQLEDFFDDIF